MANRGPKETKLSRWSAHATIAGFILAILSLWFGWKTYQRSTETQVEQMLDEAADALNGGIAGSKWIYEPLPLTEERLRQLEIVKRKISQAMDLAPKNPRVHDTLGIYCMLLGRTNDAREEFQHSIRLDPTRPDPHCHLGVVLASWGMLELAVEEYEKAISLSPSYVPAYTSYANLLVARYQSKLGTAMDQATAISFRDRYLLISPDTQWIDYGPPSPGTPAEIELLDLAANALSTALEHDPNDAEVYRLLGNVRDFQKRTAEAFQAYQAAVRLAATDPNVRFDYGVALMYSGDLAGAKRQLAHALTLNRADVDAWCFLGITHHKQGRIEQSIAALLECQRLEPNHKIAASYILKWFPDSESLNAVKRKASEEPGGFAALALRGTA